MTSALLSVGIKTDAAKASLKELKAWMAQEMKGVVLSINDAAIANSVQAALKSRKFNVQIDRDALATGVESAVERGFARSQRINLDSAYLTAQVKAAVDAGLGGAKLGGSAAAGGGAFAGSELKTTIQQILTPAIDELAKAAAVLQSAVKAGNAGSRAATGRTTAAVGFSAVDPETGARVSTRTSVDATAAKTVLDQLNAEKAKLVAIQAETKSAAERVKISTQVEEIEQKLRDAAFDQYQAQQKLVQQTQIAAAFQAAENERKASARRLEGQLKQSQASERAAGAAALRSGLAANEANLTSQAELDAALAAQTEARKRALAEQNRDRELMHSLAVLELKEQVANEAKAAAEVLEAQKLMHKLAVLERKEQAAEIAAIAAKQAADERLAMSRVYDRARFDASAGGGLNAQGVKVAGAKALLGEFGAEKTRAFLGSQAFLVDEVVRLDNFAKKTAVAKQSLSAFREAMNDAHSAARGFAGSMGAMWVTWGSTVPLIAAAALGGALRSVFVVGKDLEFQLRFVSVLSDNAAVSIGRFGDAVRGSMVGPVEAAQAMRALAQNGLSVNEAFTALPAILNLATAGEMTLAEAALGATGVMAAFNLQVTDLGRVGDVFAKAAALSNTSVGGMVEAMKQASTVSDQYKVSLEETAASLATLAKRNITGSAAGTAFRNMMVELATPSKKASDAMKRLNLDLYDGNNQLKSYAEVIKQVRDATLLLSEKGRLTFLGEIFDERGAKAFNSLLSDYKTYGDTLAKIREESDGFSKSVVDALGTTVQGKIKMLMAEFQLVTSETFNSNNSAIKNFIDTLRSYVSSNDFKRMLEGITDGVLNLTKYLVEHGNTIFWTVTAWVALRSAVVAMEVLVSLQRAFVAATASVQAFGLAAKGAAGLLSGGLVLVASLAAEYFLLRRNTSDAAEATREFSNELASHGRTAAEHLEKLREETGLLARRNQLMREGKSAEEAAKIADAEKSTTGKVGSMRDKLNALLGDNTAGLDKANSTINSLVGTTLNAATMQELKEAMDERANLLAARQALLAQEKSLVTQENVLAAGSAQVKLKNAEAERESLNRRLIAYNETVNEIAAKSKGKVNLQQVTPAQAFGMSNAELKSLIDELEGKKNASLGGFDRRDPQGESQAHRLATAQVRQEIDALREKETAQKQAIKFIREMNEAAYNPAVYGPYMAAKLAEQESDRESIKLIVLERDAVSKLQSLKNRAGLNDADKENLDTEIQRRSASIGLMQAELKHRQALAQLRSREAARKDAVEFADGGKALRDQIREDQEKIRAKTENKVVSGAEAAEREAVLQVEARYRSEIAKYESKVEEARLGVLTLTEQIDLASGEELDKLKEVHATALANLEVEQMRLQVRRNEAKEAASTNGGLAKREFERSQTAQYGWDRFWKEYVENGTSSAQLVYNAMKSTTDRMGDALGNFVLTGKGSFKSLVASVAADLARLMASKGMSMLLQYVLQAGVAYFGGSANAAGGSNSAGFGSGAGFGNQDLGVNFAKGGVMTSRGPLPLNTYSGGGVANSPQVAIYAEARKPEAYVPLEDGRTIPVTVSGATGGGASVSIAVHVHSDGTSKTETDASGQEGMELGRKIENAVMAVIVREKRAGGQLAGVK